jgi:hypothetical protein
MFVVGDIGDDVNEYAFLLAYDVQLQFTDAFSVAAQETIPTGLAFNHDGTKMFIAWIHRDDVNRIQSFNWF